MCGRRMESGMAYLNDRELEALVLTLIGNESSRADRACALTRLLRGLAFEDEAVTRLNLYAEALEAVAAFEEFNTLGLVVGNRVVRVKEVSAAWQ